MSESTGPQKLGLGGASFVLVGYVVGASIFVLPGELAAVAGPAVFLAYLIAAIPALLYSLVIAQIGAAYPVSGSVFVLIRECGSPFFAFIYLWLILSMAVVAVPLIAFGFAQYGALILPGVDPLWLALGCIAVFTLANCLGISVAGSVQGIMVLWFLGMLVLFAGTGAVAGDSSRLVPLMPLGLSGVLVAAATAYFSYAGVVVIAEIAGEIETPGRNIPRVIALAFFVVTAVYFVVPLALSMMMPWRAIAGSSTPVVTAAVDYMSPLMVQGLLLAALAASATSVNGIILGLSRDLRMGAAEGLFPSIFARLNPDSGAPVGAVVLLGAIAVVGTLFSGGILAYAQVAVVGLLLTQILSSLALLRLPHRRPELLANSGFKLAPGVLRFACVGSIVISVAFILVMVVDQPRLVLVAGGYLLLGLCYFHLRGGAAR